MTLPEKLLALHECLSAAGIEHAFGGAIALAYWTQEPRGTRDIDVNVFVTVEEAPRVLSAFPGAIEHDASTLERISQDGQVRLWWDETPVDLFFSYEPLHEAAEGNRRMVPFDGERIPVLGPVELAVLKAMFDRTRDWADIEEMLAAGTLDVDAVRDHLVDLASQADERLGRLDEARRRAADRGRGREP